MRVNVVLFGGGRGTTSIASALVAHDQLSLTTIINAYDDGLSTGRIRAFVPGMLGPSDIRKNISTLMPSQERCHRAIKKLLDYRFPIGTTREQALADLKPIATRAGALPNPDIALAYTQLTNAQLSRLAEYTQTYLDYEAAQWAKGVAFDYGDCAIGNLLFAGCYIARGMDFNAAIDDTAALCECSAEIVNATSGKNNVLVALGDSGEFFPDEASIVSPHGSPAIAQIHLLDDYLPASERAELEALDIAGRQRFLSARTRYPEPNPRALEAIRSADIIIYGPGTQHSSLMPTYLTKGIGEAIAANKSAEKVLIVNINYDEDIRGETADSLIRKFQTYMNRNGELNLPLSELMSRAIVQASDGSVQAMPGHDKYVPVDLGKLSGHAVSARNWEAEPGRHLGGLIVDEMLGIFRAMREVRLHPYRHMTSMIVPVLDEERTIDGVLSSLEALDLADLDIEKEIILVDGGSSDRTVEIARQHSRVRIFQAEKNAGRGAAIRLGLTKARGDIVVLFPGDNEYSVSDIRALIMPILRNQFNAVIGSRSIKCINLDTRIRHIYGKSQVLYFVSKYGGMMISILCLLLYNRYVSDPLSTLKAFDRISLDDLKLESNGVDLDTEIIAKLSRRQDFILEVPVNYVPRTRAQGKKIGTRDGFSAIAALFRYRRAPAVAPEQQTPLSRANASP